MKRLRKFNESKVDIDYTKLEPKIEEVFDKYLK